MTAEHALGLVVAHVGLAVGGVGLLAVLQSSLPGLSEAGARTALGRPGRSLVLGGGAVFCWVGLAGLADRAGAPLLGLVLLVLASLLVCGAALVTARALGERVGVQLERRLSPLGAVWVGWLSFMALGFVPFLGWAVMGFALTIGLGAALRGGPAPPREAGGPEM